MSLSVAPTQSRVRVALRAFLLSILPDGIEVVEGQDNRVPEPKASDFVIMTVIRRQRLATNIDTYADARFIGSIAGDTMTVDEVDFGAIVIGRYVFGTGVADGTQVTALGNGTGGPGTYKVAPSQDVSQRVLADGVQNIMQPTMIVFQIDIHGPASADNAQTISTLLRDDYGVRAFAALDPLVVPLHADDPKQMPFINGENQYEDRWIVEACLQADGSVEVPQQFADTAVVGVINVDASYPP